MEMVSKNQSTMNLASSAHEIDEIGKKGSSKLEPMIKKAGAF